MITSCKIPSYYARQDFSGIRDTLRHWLGTSGFDHEKCRLPCTQTLFYFSFRSFRRHLRARKNERGARERKIENVCRHLWEKWGLLSFFFPHHYPLALSWLSINPLRFIFYHLRSTDFEEKIEGLWKHCRPILSALFFYLFLTRVNYFFGAANLKCHNKQCKFQSLTPALAHTKWAVLIQWTYLVVNKNIVTVTRWKCDTMFFQGLKEEVKRTVMVTLTRGVHWSWCATYSQIQVCLPW